MKVQVGEETLRIRFEHHPKARRASAGTTCQIFQGNSEAPLAEVTMRCHSKEDKFSKPKGRQLSLARALQEAKLSRPVRTQIWDVYWRQHRDRETPLGKLKDELQRLRETLDRIAPAAPPSA